MKSLEEFSWPLVRLGEAMEVLARTTGLTKGATTVPPPPAGNPDLDQATLGQWVDLAGTWLGIEAEPADIPYGQVEQYLKTVGSAILRIPGRGEARFVALAGGRRTTLLLLGLDGAIHPVRLETLRSALCRELESVQAADVDQLLKNAGISGRRHVRARAALIRDKLESGRIRNCWSLRLPPGAGFGRQVHQAGILRRVAIVLFTHAAQYVLWLLSWWMVGRATLEGRLDHGWLVAWALMLMTLVPLRLLETWLAGIISIGTGGLLKKRLLHGAMRLEPEEIRHKGAGQLLSCVLESDVVESLALSGGFLGLVAAIELLIAGGVLFLGAGGVLHALLLVGWLVLAGILCARYAALRRQWTGSRLEMTDGLVESMVGHRTRLAQEVPERRHEGEEQALEGYLERSRRMDRASVVLVALVPRGWLLVGIIGIVPAFVSGNASQALLAVSLGGILLAYRALEKLSAGLSNLVGAWIAWRQISFLFHAAARHQTPGSPTFALSRRAEPAAPRAVLQASDLIFRYRERSEPVLRGCSLIIRSGDRILLEGHSGGGKSTLASLLVGIRVPESGLVLLEGLDRHTLGFDGWRRRVVAAPQFHENHVLSETFAFNLLMGRRWPPEPEDMQEARTLCNELGLGELLERMPAGLLQMVGESGWQLSHGERSRLYIARALLQGANLVILDESFAALDPETLRRALTTVLQRASTLLVIAHP